MARLGRLQQRAHLAPAFLEEAALLGEGDGFVEVGAGAEVVAEFVMGRAEAGSGVEGAEPAHGIVALLDAPVILLDPVVHVAAGAMAHVGAERLPHRTRIGVVPIGGHLLRRLPHRLQRTGEEPLGRVHVPRLAQHGLHQVAIRVDRPIEVAPAPLHLDVGAG